MKASAIGWELEIKLTDEEILQLETQTLEGKIKVYDVQNNHENLGEFPLKIKVGETNQNQLTVELQTMPNHVYIDKVETYIVIISPHGYQDLRKTGSILDRMARNAGCKVLIKNQNQPSY